MQYALIRINIAQRCDCQSKSHAVYMLAACGANQPTESIGDGISKEKLSKSLD